MNQERGWSSSSGLVQFPASFLLLLMSALLWVAEPGSCCVPGGAGDVEFLGMGSGMIQSEPNLSKDRATTTSLSPRAAHRPVGGVRKRYL